MTTSATDGSCREIRDDGDEDPLLFLCRVALHAQRVRVYWSGNKRYYHGRIVKRGVYVKYDDGDEQWESDYEME